MVLILALTVWAATSRAAQEGQEGCFLPVILKHFQAPTAEQVPPDKRLRKMVPAQNHL